MRDIDPVFQAQLESGATTHCRCWRIDRNFAPALGFTDHDCDIEFDGVVFEAASGFAASEIERSLGLAIDNGSASGALRSGRITETDILGGAFDGAEIRQWIVDWKRPENRLLTFRGEVGEIRRGETAFEVELRGLAERLNRPVGRSFLHICDAELGDDRCRADVDGAAFRAQAVIVGVPDARSLEIGGTGDFEEGWFDDGSLTWTSGALSGRSAAVATHRSAAGRVVITLADDLVVAPQPGDTAEMTAGCDKRIETCRAKFGNVKNFRGFPFIPGDTWIAAYPVDGGDHDGGSLG